MTLESGHEEDHQTFNRNSSADRQRASVLPLPPISPGGVAELFVKFLDIPAVKYGVLVLHVIAVAVSINWAIALTGRTQLTYDPPEDSYSWKQKEVVKSYFPAKVDATGFFVLIEWEDENRTDDITLSANEPRAQPYLVPNQEFPPAAFDRDGTAAFTRALQIQGLIKYCDSSLQPGRSQLQADVLILPLQCATNRISAFNGYWTLHGTDPYVAEVYTAPDKSNTMIAISLSGDNLGIDTDEDEFSDWLDEEVEKLSEALLRPMGIKATPFSIAGGVDQILDTVVEDLLLADGIAIPLALIVCLLVLRNARLMLWPIATILSTTLISMAIVAEIANQTTISVIATPLMISLVVGLPVGHALFMLNRYREALLEGEACYQACVRMFSTAGTTVCLSQICLALCALVTAFVDVDMVRGLALALLVCVCVAFSSAILLGPCMLLSFPSFFEAAAERNKFLNVVQKRQTVALATQMRGRASHYDGRASLVPQVTPQLEDTLWHRFASVTQVSTIQNFIIVLLIVIFVIPFMVVLFRSTSLTDSMKVYLPRRDDFTDLADRVFASYGSGVASPFEVVVLPPPDDSTFSPADSQWQNVLTDFVPAFTEVPHFNPGKTVGAMYTRGVTVPAMASLQCGAAYLQRVNAQQPPNASLPGVPPLTCDWVGLSMVAYGAYSSLTDFPQVRATNMVVNLAIDPMSPEATDFIQGFKELQEAYSIRGGPRVYMTGQGMNSHDAIERVKDSTRWLVGSFVAIGFIVILLGTWSVMVAVRCVFTTYLTIVFSLGFTTLTYCHGALDWTDASALSTFRTTPDGDGSVHYVVYIIALPLIIGFAVGHELFLVSASLEWYHFHLLETREAIKMALIGVGWMNIMSGLILAVSFMGHLFARLPLLNQVSFAVFWALIFDVLVVRTVLVPTLMAPFGKYNWWPATQRAAFMNMGESETHRSASADGHDIHMATQKEEETTTPNPLREI